MIVSASTLAAMDEFEGVTTDTLTRKAKSVEELIRAYTNNKFQVIPVRFTASSEGAVLTADDTSVLSYLVAGDTVEISQSGVNDGLYVVSEVGEDTVTIDESVFTVDSNLVTKIKYPVDVVEGAINMLIWDVENRQKVGIKSETLSRHSVTYFDQDSANTVMGYPVSLLGFLKPYIKARF